MDEVGDLAVEVDCQRVARSGAAQVHLGSWSQIPDDGLFVGRDLSVLRPRNMGFAGDHFHLDVGVLNQLIRDGPIGHDGGDLRLIEDVIDDHAVQIRGDFLLELIPTASRVAGGQE